MSVPLDASLNARSLLPSPLCNATPGFRRLVLVQSASCISRTHIRSTNLRFQTIDPSDVYSMHGYINYSLNRQVYVVTS